ncbi:MAG TPA: ribbon-helix-helix protein, CopG family [Candidatus Avalokitesvara rifleensis]|uniref:ribbon-helix-helix protein, CopG family n=1 Tax=Candidatus Avalokitesvara rifleensis TaxID=3367620 RepID=UPI00271238B2|nr:ribbon-helix-helix protein, CopG family [Candidatus Brocadiales bacterium]
MSTQMIIRIDPDLKEKLNKLARTEGKTTSQVVRELIEDHVKEHDISSYIDDLWERVGKRLRSKGVTPADVGRAVRDVRKGRPGQR